MNRPFEARMFSRMGQTLAWGLLLNVLVACQSPVSSGSGVDMEPPSSPGEKAASSSDDPVAASASWPTPAVTAAKEESAVKAPTPQQGLESTGLVNQSGKGSATSSGSSVKAEPVPPPAAPAQKSDAASVSLRTRSSVSGCLKSPEQAEARSGATRAGPGPMAGLDAPERYELDGGIGSISVNQTFNHACCLSAKTASSQEGRKITVTTTLMGEPCRCRCASTILSAVSVSAGRYEVAIVHDGQGGPKTVHTEEVTVQ